MYRFSASCNELQVSQKNLFFKRRYSEFENAFKHDDIDESSSISIDKSKNASSLFVVYFLIMYITLSQFKHLVSFVSNPSNKELIHVLAGLGTSATRSLNSG
jgi:hypothetical protein